MTDDTLAPLFPDLALPRPLLAFEVLLTVPRDGETLGPDDAPRGRGVVAAFTAEKAEIGMVVRAPSLTEAVVLGLAACGEWAAMPGARLEVQPVSLS
jgi:hypothetical protein